MSKSLNKIKVCVEEGNYYEAHQMLVSVSQRLLKQTKKQEALDLLQQGVLTMLNAKEWASALDLAGRLISFLDNNSFDDSKDRLLTLFCEFPVRESCCDDFVKMICKWSAAYSQENPMGDPTFHHAFGIRYYQETLNYEAESHLICGTLDSAKLVSNLHYRWYKSQKTILDPGKIEHASVALNTFLDLVIAEDSKVVKLNNLSDREVVITSFSWVTLSQLILVTVQRRSKSHYKSLLNQFETELSFDSFLKELVYDHIGSKFFDMGPKKVANPLQDMMKNLFMPQQPPSEAFMDTDMD